MSYDLTNPKLLKEWDKIKDSDVFPSLDAFAELFYQTVHTVNAKDYAQEQLCVWATGHIDLSAWNKSFLEHNTRVAVKNDIIALNTDAISPPPEIYLYYSFYNIKCQ